MPSNLVCRNVNRDDLESIEKLNAQQEFRLKDLDNCVIDKIVLENEKEIAYGITKYFAEAIILVNHDVPKITRMKALRELLSYAIWGSKRQGLKQLHVFVLDPKLAEVLKKHYGFKELDGIPLVKDL